MMMMSMVVINQKEIHKGIASVIVAVFVFVIVREVSASCSIFLGRGLVATRHRQELEL